MNMLGEKTPPEAPEPRVRQVTRSLATARRRRKPTAVSSPRRMSMMVA
jgi:hypothetical protein